MSLPVQVNVSGGPYMQTREILFESQAYTTTVTDDTATTPAVFQYDLTSYTHFGLTVQVATNALKVGIDCANKSDFSDAVGIISLASRTVGFHFWTGGTSMDSYAVAPCPFRFVRLKVQNDSAGVFGTLTVVACGKNT